MLLKDGERWPCQAWCWEEGKGLSPQRWGDAPSALPGTAVVLFGFEMCPEPGGSFGSGSRLPREFLEGVCHLNLEISLEEGTEI